jgi:alkylated DNA repair dioxygenase AlkB
MRKRPAGQPLLFDSGHSLPNGLVYRPDFITETEEAALVSFVGSSPLVHATDGTGRYVAKRRIIHFGWGLDPEGRLYGTKAPLPKELRPFALRIAKWLGIGKSRVVEALVNEYSAGTALGWHRDNERCEHIIGISLSGWARMRFRPARPKGGRSARRDPKDVLALTLEPRSAYVMQGSVRRDYQHSVAAVPALRYSITFRTLPA